MEFDHFRATIKRTTKCNYWLISAKRTSISPKFVIFFLFLVVQKKAQNGTNGEKNIFFRLLFCFHEPETVKNYFAWSRLGAFSVILPMQLDPPKFIDGVSILTRRRSLANSALRPRTYFIPILWNFHNCP